MAQNILRGGFVIVDREDVKIIDSNVRLEEKMKIWGQPTRTLDGAFDEDAMEFSGLNPEQVDTGGEDGSVIKGDPGLASGEQDGTPDPDYDVEQVAHDMLKHAEEQLEAASRESERIIAAAADEIARLKEEAADEGRRMGYNEGIAQGMAEIEKMRAAIFEERESLHQEYNQLVDELEPRFIELLTEIYERVFAVELKDLAPIAAHLLANTMRESGETKSFIVRVAAADYEYIMKNRDLIRDESAIGEANLEIIRDQTLSSGSCLIETAGGVFDAGFDTQLAGLNKKLRLLSFEK